MYRLSGCSFDPCGRNASRTRKWKGGKVSHTNNPTKMLSVRLALMVIGPSLYALLSKSLKAVTHTRVFKSMSYDTSRLIKCVGGLFLNL